MYLDLGKYGKKLDYIKKKNLKSSKFIVTLRPQTAT